MRLAYAVLYSVLCAAVLIINRREIPDALRAAWDVLRGWNEEAVDRVAGAEE
jgi:hypothetical protein